MSLFNENPKSIFINIKELLALAVTDRHHTFHTPVFSKKCGQKASQFSKCLYGIQKMGFCKIENVFRKVHFSF